MEATVILARCPDNRQVYGMRTEKMPDGDWRRNWAFALDERRAKSEGYDRLKVRGSLRYTAEYPGCPYCGAKNPVAQKHREDMKRYADDYKKTKEEVKERLKEHFKPEFLNRIDEIIVFDSLQEKELLQIVDLMLNDTIKALKEKDISFEISDSAKQFILEKGTNIKFGARPLRRAIQRHIEDEIAEKILRGEVIDGQIIKIDSVDNNLTFEIL